MTTIEQKHKEVYETMADKTLSFGCVLKMEESGEVGYGYYVNEDEYFLNQSNNERSLFMPDEGFDYEVIGHPLTIGHCLDWIRNNIKEECCPCCSGEVEYVEEQRDGPNVEIASGRYCKDNNCGRGEKPNPMGKYYRYDGDTNYCLIQHRKDLSKPIPIPGYDIKGRENVIEFLYDLIDANDK